MGSDSTKQSLGSFKKLIEIAKKIDKEIERLKNEKEEIEKALIYECERFYKVFKKIQKRG